MPSSTVENYIKHIYLLSDRAGSLEVPVGRVADALNVVPGTATTMMKALADAGLVVYAPRVGVQLTAAGRKLALHVLRRHRLIEQFLVEVLNFDWTEVHEEAEQLEHVVSELLLERIDRFLGYPTEDPHGDPIPSASGELREASGRSLVDCEFGDVVEVERIADQNKAFLDYVTEVGLGIGVRVKVLAHSAVAETSEIEIEGTLARVSMGNGAAAKIMVR
ncbi:MAG: metal-dependent transcriptional regulator [Opitutales bacterium]